MFKHVISVLVLICSVTAVFSQPIYTEYECPNVATSHFVSADIVVGSSSWNCSSGTAVRGVIGGDAHLIESINVYKLQAGNNSTYAVLEIMWKPGSSTGLVEIDILQERSVNEGTKLCSRQGWQLACVYKIYRGAINPGGVLLGASVYPSTNGEASISISYEKGAGYQKEVNTVKFTIEGSTFTINKQANQNTIDITHSLSGFGSYYISTEVLDDCGNFQTGPTKTVEIKPSCYNDNPNNISFDLSGSGITRYDEGLGLTKDNQYTAVVSGVTDFASHYDLEHDGGGDIILSGTNFTMKAGLGSYRLEAIRKESRNECEAIPPLSLFVGGHDFTIEDNCLITLPGDLEAFGFNVTPGDPALAHFAAHVTSKKGFIIKPGVTLSMGAELILDYEIPVIDDSELNPDMNFIQSTAYDDYGRVILESRNYFDSQGRMIQTQVKNLEKDVIITTEVLNDFYGRPVLSTLPAPSKAGTFNISEDDCGDNVQTGSYVHFEYKENFINGDPNNPYDYTKFDLDITNTINREESPLPVVNTEEGTLGWYYSSNNGSAVGDDNSKMNEPLVAQTDYPYTRTLFHHDGTENIKSVAGPGDIFRAGGGHVAVSDQVAISETDRYLDEYLKIREDELGYVYPEDLVKTENFFKTTSISADEIGKTSWVYMDKAGKAIISLFFGTKTEPITTSYSFYDDMGRLIVNLTPNGWEQYNSGVAFDLVDKTSYFYDFQGRLLATEETDAGRSEFMYRKDGSIRFSQNAEQLLNKEFSYTNYDNLGRPIESGQLTLNIDFDFRGLLTPELKEVEGEWIDNLAGAPVKTDWVKTIYDSPDKNFNSETGLSTLSQRFVRGAVSVSQNENTKTWYSYDERGRVEWVAQNINGFGTKLIEYIYGPTGAVELIAYQKGKEDEFYHFYTYDKDGRLSKVYTAVDEPTYNVRGEIENPEVLKQQALYDYYLHGPLKRVELADQLQGIDFVYTITGQLKAINDANPDNDPGEDGLGDSGFKPDVFGMSFDYYNGDHQNGSVIDDGIEQFTGNIKAQSWHSPVDGGVQRGYVYNYDQRNQLINAKIKGFETLPNAFNMSLSGYDLNGNIKGLSRNDNFGDNLHDLNYNYVTNKNKLDNVTHAGDPYKSYVYNEIGQLKSQIDEVTKEKQLMEYDVTGKVTSVYKQKDGENKLKLSDYLYDDRGFRVSKIIYEDDGLTKADQIWYVRDASGSLLRSYNDSNNTLDEYPIYGAGRLGMYRPNAIWNDYLYEINDNLGNVRAVLGKDITVEYLATFEGERINEEDNQAVDVNGNTGYFGSWANHQIPTYNHTPFDITEDGVPLNLNETLLGGVVRINNDMDVPIKPIRATKMIPVAPGDKMNLEVYVKYADFTATNESVIGDILENYVANSFGSLAVGSSAIDGVIGNIFDPVQNPFFDPEDLFTDPVMSQPKAYLNYIVFDKDFKVIASDRKQVSQAAKIPNKPVLEDAGKVAFDLPHERLSLEDIDIKQAGFMYIYLSSEDQQNMDVYFDDLRITHSYTNVVAGSDFYPFGLTMESRDINREEYKYGYQGQFAEEDEETGWNHFELRMYDPVIGRWTNTDPAGQFNSPFVGMGNNPINSVDPDGAFNQGVDQDGNIVFDDGLNDGNVFLVNDGFTGEINDLATLQANSMQLVSDYKWIGSEIQLKDFVLSQWKFVDFEWSYGVNVNESNNQGFSMNTKSVIKTSGSDVIIKPKSIAEFAFDIRYSKTEGNVTLGNIYNLRNSLEHEKAHYISTMSMIHSGIEQIRFSSMERARQWSEHGAINFQRSRPTWNKTDVNYKSFINSYWNRVNK